MPDYLTKEEFKKFLEELSVTISDLKVNPEFAWKYYNSRIFDFKSKEIKFDKNKR